MAYYKIVRKGDGDTIRFLFHGVNGSRTIPKNEWLYAKQKKVQDGNNGTFYRSGFHVFTSREGAEKYLDLFKTSEDKKVVKCEVEDIWHKEHSRSDEVRLASAIKVVE